MILRNLFIFYFFILDKHVYILLSKKVASFVITMLIIIVITSPIMSSVWGSHYPISTSYLSIQPASYTILSSTEEKEAEKTIPRRHLK